jgi:hypothetical protein
MCRVVHVHGFEVKEAAPILATSTPGLVGSSYFRDMADAPNPAGDGPPDRALLIASRSGTASLRPPG